MARVAVATDSNSGITQAEGKELGIFVLPMPFFIDGELFLEDITLSQEEFYAKLVKDADISTSQPAVTDVSEFWDKILEEYDEIVYIPMSSGLSGACQTAMMIAQDYDEKVYVVNNQRISATQKLSALEAKYLAEQGMSAKEIHDELMEHKMDSTIYISLETLKYLKKGGRITPAAAALGTILKIKPVLQIQGEKLDAFSKVRSMKSAKQVMLSQIQKDGITRFGATSEALENCIISVVYSGNKEQASLWREELKEVFPNHTMMLNPLSLSVSCHIGDGALAITCTKKLDRVDYSQLIMK
ncbi:MAG: DegV family protein [Lachnospiraceae bacterium]|nr:DegV family protein [Lachnospiraceae bacterium]